MPTLLHVSLDEQMLFSTKPKHKNLWKFQACKHVTIIETPTTPYATDNRRHVETARVRPLDPDELLVSGGNEVEECEMGPPSKKIRSVL